MTWKTLSLAGLGLVAALLGQAGWGHGGVYLEEDLCVIRVGYLKAHFTIFQPRTRRYEEFCEDLPDVTESVFVLEYAHEGLSETALDFRIIRDVTGLGRFARWRDVAAIADIDAATVVHKPAGLEPDVFMLLHEFEEPGNYIGIVTATQPGSGEQIRAVFPFQVGFAVGLGYWPLLLVALILIQANYWRMRRRGASTALASVVVIVLLGTAVPNRGVADDSQWPLTQVAGSFRVALQSQVLPIPTHQIHSWVVRLTTPQGEPVADADIQVAGGMPAHDHGLQTSPQVTQYLGEGKYLIEGMKFHMGGAWELSLQITAIGAIETATFQINL